MGFNTGGALATLIAVNKANIVQIPDHWSLAEAATIPVVYGTVLYGFIVVGC